MQVAGEMGLGETGAAGNAVFARITGFPGRLLAVASCLAPYLLGVATLVLLDVMPSLYRGRELLWWVLFVSLSLLPFLIGSLSRRLVRSAHSARGVSEASLCRYEADEEGLRVTSDGGDHGLAWRKVSEIMLYRGLWIFVAGTSLCLPRRFFADAAAEVAFLNYALAHIPFEAVTRSRDASLVCSGKAASWTLYGQGVTP